MTASFSINFQSAISARLIAASISLMSEWQIQSCMERRACHSCVVPRSGNVIADFPKMPLHRVTDDG